MKKKRMKKTGKIFQIFIAKSYRVFKNIQYSWTYEHLH